MHRKRTQVVSEITGVTGMAILQAIVNGERDAQKLAKLRDPRCSKTEQEIAEQLSGHWREDHLFSLQQALKMYEVSTVMSPICVLAFACVVPRLQIVRKYP